MLKRDREQFVRRQAELQARITRDASVKAKSRDTKPNDNARVVGKFSDNMEAYQKVLDVQRLPVNAQMKRVIECLEKDRRGLTAEEIQALTLVDINRNSELKSSLESNLKIKIDGLTYRYKAKHELGGKNDLLKLISKRKDGIALSDLKDSYESVLKDAQELREEGLVFILQNHDTQDEIFYPNDSKRLFQVDEDVKALFRSIHLPEIQDVEGELMRMGMKSFTNSAKRNTLLSASREDRDKPKTKRRKESKRTKYTNVHLPELLKGIDLPPGM